jgi:N-acetylglucosaminyldiphosphoundecaprenol N-acetyl-beta-D-mannosaminyltransferase
MNKKPQKNKNIHTLIDALKRHLVNFTDTQLSPSIVDNVGNLLEKFPGSVIAGSYAPPFRPLTAEEDDDVVRRINQSGADIVWVGLSTPKQERWMAVHRDRLSAGALIGVGAAFDFHAGLKLQAPRFIQRSGFEWLFRMAVEPRRLWRRYLTNNPRFILGVVSQLAGIRHYPLDGLESER